MIFLICLMLFFCCIFVVLFLLGFLWILINVFNFILIFLNLERICLVCVSKFIYLIVYFDLKDVNCINKGMKCCYIVWRKLSINVSKFNKVIK